MRVTIPLHAQRQARERGVTEAEIIEAISRGGRVAAHSGRIGAEIIVPFAESWGRRGKVYPQKRVIVFFVEENDEAVVVTVISQFGEWR